MFRSSVCLIGLSFPSCPWKVMPQGTKPRAPTLVFWRRAREAALSEASWFKGQRWLLQLAPPPKPLPQPALAPEVPTLAKVQILEGSWPLFHLKPVLLVCHRSPSVPKFWIASWVRKCGEISIPTTLPPNDPFLKRYLVCHQPSSDSIHRQLWTWPQVFWKGCWWPGP